MILQNSTGNDRITTYGLWEAGKQLDHQQELTHNDEQQLVERGDAHRGMSYIHVHHGGGGGDGGHHQQRQQRSSKRGRQGSCFSFQSQNEIMVTNGVRDIFDESLD